MLAADSQRLIAIQSTLLALLAVLVLAAAPATARAAISPGAVTEITWGISRGDIDRTVAEMQGAGVRWIRANVSWKELEPDSKGSYDQYWMGEFDYAISKAQAAGIQVVMPLSDSVPYWASADPQKYTDSRGAKHWNTAYRPAHMEDYADAFRYIVAHYSAMGVNVYEVWNEQNTTRFWPSGPSAAEYTQMLAAAYPAIKAANPQATVLFGGVAQNDVGFLEAVYANGGGSYFDAVATHVYPKAAPDQCWSEGGRLSRHALCGVEEIHKTMVAHGDGSKQVWLTEFGYATCRNTSSACWNMGVTEEQQADYLTRSFQQLSSYPWIATVLWYGFRNVYWLHDDPDDLEATFGLMRTDFSPKPALAAFRAYATGAVSATPPPAETTISTKVVRGKKRSRSSTGSLTTQRIEVIAQRLRVIGRVRGAKTGTVIVRVERRTGKRWRAATTRKIPVRKSGRFSSPMRLRCAGKSKLWRVRARYSGSTGSERSTSPYRRFRACSSSRSKKA
jgi:polysaccharide biosynthesis protein PslG